MPFSLHARARTCCALFLAGGAAPLGAAPPPPATSDTVADYSHLVPLTVSGKEAVVQLRLPQAVYLHARSSDLRDLRVFDARGTRLAFAVVAAPPQVQTGHRKLPVKVFPVIDSETRQANSAGLDIRTSPDGAVLSVSTRAGAGSAAGTAPSLSSLILDLRQTDGGAQAEAPAIDALRLTLPAGTRNYTARVELAVSNDLQRWDSLGDTLLSWLVNTNTETLANDRIAFEPTHFRYARLTWSAGVPIQFASISAESPVRTEVALPVERMTLQPLPGQVGQDLVYQSALAIPVQGVGLQFGEQNVVMPALLGHYVELPSRQFGQPNTVHFEPAFRATFYQLTQDGKSRSSGDFAVAETHRAEWVLRPEAAAGGKPSLRLSWSPATLVFVANGQAPYTLAVGRDKATPASLDLAQVAPGFSNAELRALEPAVTGPVQQQRALAGAASAADAAGMSARSRMALLWGVLLLGVAILGAMVWRLIKQMR